MAVLISLVCLPLAGSSLSAAMASPWLPYSDTAPVLSQPDDTEDEEGLRAKREREEEGDVQVITGISPSHAIRIVGVLCFVNLLNYMDRFTVAGERGLNRELRKRVGS